LLQRKLTFSVILFHAKVAGTIDIASEYVTEINILINYLLHVTE